MSIGSPLREPCATCGEETASGSIFYSDRHTIAHSDGTRSFLCELCNTRIRSSHLGGRMTDDEVRSYVENGSNAGIVWGNGGPMGV
jgi:hypothetical protein